MHMGAEAHTRTHIDMHNHTDAHKRTHRHGTHIHTHFLKNLLNSFLFLLYENV